MILGPLLALVVAAAAADPAIAPATPGRAEARDAAATATVDKPKIAIGEPFTLTVEVAHAAADTVSLPDPLPLGELVLRGPVGALRTAGPEAGRATTRFTAPLVDLKTLAPRVPEIALRLDGPAGPRQTLVKAVALSLASAVEPDGQPTKEKGPRPPKQPVAIAVRSYLWVAVLAGAVALGLLLWGAAVLGKRASERRRLRAIPPPLTAEELAMARIMDLKKRAPWTSGQGRAAIFELSEIVRGYLGERLGFGAVDLTSEELLRELRRRRILGLDLAELTEELSWEDLVKFAKLEPTAVECEEALVRAAELIERTRPLPEPLPPLARPGARA